MEILIERFKDRIHLFSPYDPQIVDLCKEIPGHGITRKNGFAWTFPCNWSTCLALRETFGEYLVLGPRLTRWATVERAHRSKARKIGKLSKADLSYVTAQAPALGAALATRTYQQVGAAFVAHRRSALLADEPGLGKTLQAMAAVIEAEITGCILVLAPATALDATWEEELARWAPEDGRYLAVGDRAKRTRVIAQAITGKQKRRWLLCNFEMLRSYPRLLKTHWASVVVDESQRLLITRGTKQKQQSAQRWAAGKLRVAPRGIRLAMSGTPYRGKIENMWGTLNWLYPNQYKSFWHWYDTWFEVFTDTSTGEVFTEGIAPGKKKEFYREIDSIILRRTKREVAPDMPRKLYAGWPLDASDPNSPVGVWLPLTPAQRKAYDEISRWAEAELEGGSLMANGVLAELTRMKQFATTACKIVPKTVRKREAATGEMVELEVIDVLPKLPSNKLVWLLNWMDERGMLTGELGGKVIVASQFTRILNMLAKELDVHGAGYRMITGEVVGPARKQAKNDFQKDPNVRVMLLATKAGGVSLTLDQADDVVFLDETWDPDDATQVEDRADRVSRSGHQVTVWYVRSLDTLEEAIAADNAALDSIQHELQDGRRGVARAKALLAYKTKR